jgi:hypothetical protein
MCVFESVFEALLVPRGQEEELLHFRIVLSGSGFITELQVFQ